MGRPREHDDTTRLALLDAAERIVEEEGPESLSVRAAADAVGVSTRAVYSTFGSKSGLLDGLVQRAYELLASAITRLPTTKDPARDLVEAALRVFRPMAIGHPSLFRLAFLRVVPDLDVGAGTRAAATEAFDSLCDRFRRLEAAGGLGGRDPRACAAASTPCAKGWRPPNCACEHCSVPTPKPRGGTPPPRSSAGSPHRRPVHHAVPAHAAAGDRWGRRQGSRSSSRRPGGRAGRSGPTVEASRDRAASPLRAERRSAASRSSR
jgi:AcrR family transcriptional regulator